VLLRSLQQVRTAIELEPSLPIRALLIVAWALAARVGDVQKMLKSRLTLTGTQLTATYVVGKTVARRGPYSCSTTLAPEHAAQVARWLETRRVKKSHIRTTRA
jgi:phage host-nuclease inhibitor protein Gam